MTTTLYKQTDSLFSSRSASYPTTSTAQSDDKIVIHHSHPSSYESKKRDRPKISGCHAFFTTVESLLDNLSTEERAALNAAIQEDKEHLKLLKESSPKRCTIL